MKYHKKNIHSFRPEEILFSPTTNCNLACLHCATKRSKGVLPVEAAKNFLRACKKEGIRRIGFTGGEPFLAVNFLSDVIKEALAEDMIFDRIMTNGVWFADRKGLEHSLEKVHGAGYDGSICVSVDAFHKQDVNKIASFIKTAWSIWGRGDIVSIAYVGGAREQKTRDKLKGLARCLKARLAPSGSAHPYIKNKDIFIKIQRIALSPAGIAGKLKDPWDGRWFQEDRCKGPGNTFYIMPNGDVKPCCGYATDLEELTIGNIFRDSPKELVEGACKNRLVHTIFNSGLSAIRKRLEKTGFRFPGKTSNHCYFCYYLITEVPSPLLAGCLD